MKVLTVTTAPPLSGDAVIHGAKNSALPILAGCCACKGCFVLRNCPNISDVENACAMIRALGGSTKREGDCLLVDTRALSGFRLPEKPARSMRASVLFTGALLTACGKASLFYPGGCSIGQRPIDLHLAGFHAMGAELLPEEGGFLCQGSLLGANIRLDYPSVGATENLMLAALKAKGETRIENAAREPEIADLARFLNSCGAHILGTGTETVRILPTQELTAAEYTLMPDRMETATYLCACAGCGGEIFLRNTSFCGIDPVLQSLKQGGCTVRQEKNGIRMERKGKLSMWEPVATGPYPAFPTDAQPMLVAAFLRASGKTRLLENVFDGRFAYCSQLQKLGGRVYPRGRSLMLQGCDRLTGTELAAADLRAGAALLIAAMQAEGKSRISGVEHLLRGYDNLEKQLQSLGADVKTVEISNSL